MVREAKQESASHAGPLAKPATARFRFTLTHKRAALTASSVLLLCGVFFASSTAKILFWQETLDASQIVFGENMLALFIAVLVIAVEVIIALLLVLPSWWERGGMMAAIVLIVFTALAFLGKSQGIITECPCFGKAFSAEIGWPLAVRNAVLLLASLAVAHVTSSSQERDPARRVYSWFLNQGTFLLAIVNVFLLGMFLMITAHR